MSKLEQDLYNCCSLSEEVGMPTASCMPTLLARAPSPSHNWLDQEWRYEQIRWAWRLNSWAVRVRWRDLDGTSCTGSPSQCHSHRKHTVALQNWADNEREGAVFTLDSGTGSPAHQLFLVSCPWQSQLAPALAQYPLLQARRL